MKAKPYVLLSFTTRLDTTPWALGERILKTLSAVDERLRPDYIANAEPIKTRILSIDECRDKWAPKARLQGPNVNVETVLPFMWKRDENVKCSGHVMHTSTNAKGQMTLGQVIIRSDIERRIDWFRAFKELCAITRPKFGMLHLFTAPELTKAEFRSPQSCFQIGPAGWSLESTIPNIGWATYLGDSFASEVDMPRLMAQGFHAEHLDEDYLIATSGELFDVADNFEGFSHRRSRLKQLFKKGLFQIDTEPQ